VGNMDALVWSPEGEPGNARAEVERKVERPRVLVMDSNLMVAESIVLVLAEHTFAARLALPLSREHLSDLRAWKPDLALLNTDWVDRSLCLDCVSGMHHDGVPVVVIGGKLDLVLLSDCVNAGAVAVVDKSAPLSHLIDVIAGLLDGAVPADDSKRPVGPLPQGYQRRRAPPGPLDVLTPREKFVLGELMQGHHAEEIAARSGVSVSTVRSQIKSILQKFGVNSQLAAVAMARRLGCSPEPRHPPWTETSAVELSVSGHLDLPT